MFEATTTAPCYKVGVGVRAGIGSSEARRLVQPMAEPGWTAVSHTGTFVNSGRTD